MSTGRTSRVCECGKPKDRRARGCTDCYRPRWTGEDDQALRTMVAEGVATKAIAKQFGRSISAVQDRKRILEAHYTREQREAIKRAGKDEFWADPVRSEKWKAKHRRDALTPETRERHRQAAKERIDRGEFGCTGHDEKTRRKLSKAHLARADRRLSFAPRDHPLRKEYHELVKLLGKDEALRIIYDEIQRLPSFERQMLRVQAGANVADKLVVPSRGYEGTLGGVSSGLASEG